MAQKYPNVWNLSNILGGRAAWPPECGCYTLLKSCSTKAVGNPTEEGSIKEEDKAKEEGNTQEAGTNKEEDNTRQESNAKD